MTRVAVIGAGSWGTALANLLAGKGVDTVLWAFEEEVASNVNAKHENQIYFADKPLDARLRATSDIAQALDGADVIVTATPSHVARRVWQQASPHIRSGTPLVSATKGVEPDTLNLMDQVASEVLPQAKFVAISGPSFADEVHQGQPTAVVAASHDQKAALLAQDLFATSTFRVYSHSDVVGVELAGSLKNVMAIAAGVLDGLGLGHNPRAALLTRGLAEIRRLGEAMGAESATFAGLAGMGDLILTCTGGQSRNRQLGVALARGETLEHHRATHRTVAEGVNTALGASKLAARHGVEMPITAQVKAVLFDGVTPADSISSLMERTLKAEEWG